MGKGGKNMASDMAVDVASSQVGIPWTEKYRPKTMDGVSHQDEVVSMLRSCIDSGSLPHLLFYGPPGTGKTSTILAITKDLFGPELWKKRVLELNASDERGISVVREKIKTFAKGAIGTSGTAPPFKVIILDEADAMTADAQSAMRRTMEEYSSVTRFCLCCNYVSRIIEPIASRCAKFRFKPLPQVAIMERLSFICSEEGIKCDDESYRILFELSGGDLRKAITFMQSANKLVEVIKPQTIIDLAGVLPKEMVRDLLDTLRKDDYDGTSRQVDDIVWSGYSAKTTLSQLLETIVSDKDLTELHKAKASMKIAEVEKNLIDGASERLQMLNACSYIQCVFCDKPELPGVAAR